MHGTGVAPGGGLGVPQGGGGADRLWYTHGENQVETLRKCAPLGAARAIIAGLEVAWVAP